jgi:hypothetical protein
MGEAFGRKGDKALRAAGDPRRETLHRCRLKRRPFLI